MSVQGQVQGQVQVQGQGQRPGTGRFIGRKSTTGTITRFGRASRPGNNFSKKQAKTRQNEEEARIAKARQTLIDQAAASKKRKVSTAASNPAQTALKSKASTAAVLKAAAALAAPKAAASKAISKATPKAASTALTAVSTAPKAPPTANEIEAARVEAEEKEAWKKRKLCCADSVHDLFGIASIGIFMKYGACGSIWGYMAELVRFGTLEQITRILKIQNVGKTERKYDKFVKKDTLTSICTNILGISASNVEEKTMKKYTTQEPISIMQTAVNTEQQYQKALKSYAEACKQLFPSIDPETDIYMGYDAGLGPLATLFKEIIKHAGKKIGKEIIDDDKELKKILNGRSKKSYIPLLYVIKTPQNIADSANDVSYPEFLTIYEFPENSDNPRPREKHHNERVFVVDSNIFTKDKFTIFYRRKASYSPIYGKHQFEYVVIPVPPASSASSASASSASASASSASASTSDDWEYKIDYGLVIGQSKGEEKYVTNGPSLATLAAHYLHKALDDWSLRSISEDMVEELDRKNIKNNIISYCRTALNKISDISKSPLASKKIAVNNVIMELYYTLENEIKNAHRTNVRQPNPPQANASKSKESSSFFNRLMRLIPAGLNYFLSASDDASSSSSSSASSSSSSAAAASSSETETNEAIRQCFELISKYKTSIDESQPFSINQGTLTTLIRRLYALTRPLLSSKQTPLTQGERAPIDTISIKEDPPESTGNPKVPPKVPDPITVYDLFIEKNTVTDGTDESVNFRTALTVRMMHIIRTTLPYILGNNKQPLQGFSQEYMEVYRSFKDIMDSKHHLGTLPEYRRLTAPLFLDMKRDGDRSQVMAFRQLWMDHGVKSGKSGKSRKSGKSVMNKQYPNMLFVSHDRLCCTQMCVEGGPVTMYFSAGGNYKLIRCDDPNGCPQSGGGTLSEERESNYMQHPTLRDMLDVIAMKSSQLIETMESRDFYDKIDNEQKEKLYIDMFQEIVEYIRSIPSIDVREDEQIIESFFEKLTRIYDDKLQSLHLYIIERLNAYYSLLPSIKNRKQLEFVVGGFMLSDDDYTRQGRGSLRAIPAYLMNRSKVIEYTGNINDAVSMWKERGYRSRTAYQKVLDMAKSGANAEEQMLSQIENRNRQHIERLNALKKQNPRITINAARAKARARGITLRGKTKAWMTLEEYAKQARQNANMAHVALTRAEQNAHSSKATANANQKENDARKRYQDAELNAREAKAALAAERNENANNNGQMGVISEEDEDEDEDDEEDEDVMVNQDKQLRPMTNPKVNSQTSKKWSNMIRQALGSNNEDEDVEDPAAVQINPRRQSIHNARKKRVFFNSNQARANSRYNSTKSGIENGTRNVSFKQRLAMRNMQLHKKKTGNSMLIGGRQKTRKRKHQRR